MVSDDELIGIIDTAQERWGRPFVTASEVAELVGMTRQGIHRRLDMLHAAGDVKKYKPGKDAIWWTEELLRQRASFIESELSNK